MANTIVSVFCCFTLLSTSHLLAQSPSATSDFSCHPDSPPTCNTYLTYRAHAPKYVYVKNISDLLGISPDQIALANNLQYADMQLAQSQLLLIPINCTCNGSFYFYKTTYSIEKGDNFYWVSISNFQNLTNYIFVGDQNPEMNPTNLTIGSEINIPLLCKCPSKAQSLRGVEYIVTYVYQPEDQISTVGSMFDVPTVEILSENNYRNFTEAICLPVVIPVSHQPVIYQYSLAPSKNHKSHKVTFISVLSTFGVAILILFASLLAYCRISKRRLIRKSSLLETSNLIKGEKKPQDGSFITKKLLPGVSGYLGQPIIFNRKQIMEATINLDDVYKIGGSVYKAIIDDQVLAVKKVSGDTEELKLLQKLNHGSLVNLMGISSDFEGNCLLVFEYAENGSLDTWLHKKSTSAMSSLTWTQRLSIALDVANGLEYLHEHTNPMIVHGDIRTSNILLRSNFKAKISNFSLAKRVTSSIMSKIDVFAFGLLILELLSGKKSLETRESGEIVMLYKEIRAILEDKENKEERLRAWIDPSLGGFYPEGGALGFSSLAAACTSEKYSERPKMADIVFNLSVLTQLSDGVYYKSWMLGMENEVSVEMITPVVAR